MKTYKDLIISQQNTIKNAFKILDRSAEKVLFVVDDRNRFLGTLSDGDIRRALLAGKSLQNDIGDIFNRDPVFIYEDEVSESRVKEVFLEKKITLIPILNREGFVVVDYISWNQVFTGDLSRKRKHFENLSIPVVIMAGGKGTRLEPFTTILPKPLIPVGGKSILEHVMDEFSLFGISSFYLTLNYKWEMIKAYFNGIEHNYRINYVKEEKFLGTAGSLCLLPDFNESDFIVSNCDIIVKANYADVYNLHKKSKAYLTMVSSIQHYKIPYGVIEFGEGGVVKQIKEKPEYSFPINTGVYLLKKECLDYIPKDIFFNMTDLIEALIKDEKKVVTYPVNENDYIDTGQWEEYRLAMEKLKGL